MIDKRYQRNIPSLSEEECALLAEKRVCVIGCGGLGGYVLEHLARIGVGHITAVDGDVFDESNLNRQILSSEALIGTPKADAAARHIGEINSMIQVHPVNCFLTEENAEELIMGHDLVIDALDSPAARIILSAACTKQGITMIHGAVSGWNGQVAVIRPGSRFMENLYQGAEPDRSPSTLSFTPAVAASIEMAEAVKVLCGRPTQLDSNMLFFDLLTGDFNLFDITGLQN